MAPDTTEAAVVRHADPKPFRKADNLDGKKCVVGVGDAKLAALSEGAKIAGVR